MVFICRYLFLFVRLLRHLPLRFSRLYTRQMEFVCDVQTIEKIYLKSSTAACLSWNNAPVTHYNPQILLWTVFFGLLSTEEIVSDYLNKYALCEKMESGSCAMSQREKKKKQLNMHSHNSEFSKFSHW